MTAQHEMFIVPMRRYFGAQGFFHYGWVIPALLFLAGFGITYLRFVFVHLDAPTRRRFIAAGLIYVGAALGMEVAEGPIDETLGKYSVPARAAITVEESLEMLGIVVFVYGLLSFIAEHIGEIRVCIRQDVPSSGTRRVSDLSGMNPARVENDQTIVWDESSKEEGELAGARTNPAGQWPV